MHVISYSYRRQSLPHKAVVRRMQPTLHATRPKNLTALRAWCKQCLPGRLKPDGLRPGIEGMRGSMVGRQRPCTRMSTSPPLSRAPPPPPPPLLPPVTWSRRFAGPNAGMPVYETWKIVPWMIRCPVFTFPRPSNTYTFCSMRYAPPSLWEKEGGSIYVLLRTYPLVLVILHTSVPPATTEVYTVALFETRFSEFLDSLTRYGGRFVSFRFVSFRFVSFRFVSNLFLFLFFVFRFCT